MKKLFGVIALVVFSVVVVSAQTKVNSGLPADLRQRQAGEKRSSNHKEAARVRPSRTVRVGPSTTYLKNGLSTDEVVRLLGQPTSVSEQQEGDLLLTTYIFTRGEGRVLVAEFEKGILIRSRTEIREAMGQDTAAR